MHQRIIVKDMSSSKPPSSNIKKTALADAPPKIGKTRAPDAEEGVSAPLEPWQKKPLGINDAARTDSVEMRKLMRDGQVPDGFPGPTTVLFICTRTDSGIAPKQIVDISNVIRPMGLKVFVASPMNPPFGLELKRVADKLINIPARDFSIRALFRLRRQVVKYGINVIHSHGRTAGVYSRLLGMMTGVSVVHTFHGIPIDNSIGGKIRHFVDQLLGISKYIPIFGSAAEKERALERKLMSVEHEAILIESPVNLANFPKRKMTIAPFCKVNREQPETLKLIRIGGFLRPESTRGHEVFLKLAKETENQGQWTCAGFTKDKLIRFGVPPKTLEVAGPMSDPTKWLYSLDVFVSTSTGDGQIYGSLQAMAAGCVCLLSNVPAHQGFLKHQAALLFDPKEPTSFATALNDVRNDKALRDMLLGNARYMLERFHNAETFQGKLLEIYRSSAKRTAGLVL